MSIPGNTTKKYSVARPIINCYKTSKLKLTRHIFVVNFLRNKTASHLIKVTDLPSLLQVSLLPIFFSTSKMKKNRNLNLHQQVKLRKSIKKKRSNVHGTVAIDRYFTPMLNYQMSSKCT